MRRILLTIGLVAGAMAALVGTALAAAPTAYVVNDGSASVTPINLATKTAETPVTVGTDPTAAAITPDGKTVYVTNSASSTVTPISTATNTAGTPVTVGANPKGIAITPDGRTAYVADYNANSVMPINLATDVPGTAIPVGTRPFGIAITPNGRTAYVTDFGANSVTPINLTTGTPGTAIPVGANPDDVAITPNGKTAYVSNSNGASVTPINTATNTSGTAISMGSGLHDIAIAPDGATAFSTSGSWVNPIATATNTRGTNIAVAGAWGIAVAPGGATAYVTNSTAGTTTPLFTATGLLGPAITVGTDPIDVAITPDQAPTARFSASAATVGQTSTFNASASSSPIGSVVSYQWSFGDGQSVTTTSPTAFHVYAKPGTYTARLTVTNSAGTSTGQVFTGRTVSNEGAPQATTTHSLDITSLGHQRSPTPRLSRLRVAPRTASIAGRVVHGRCAAPTAATRRHPSCRRPVKLRISYTLNVKDRVVFTVKHKTTGRMAHGRCVKPSPGNHKHKRCTRVTGVRGQVARSSAAGADHTTFNAKLDGHKLAAGAYQLIAAPKGGAARTTQFRLRG